ncbi:MAG TPA: nodulation protein NfeD [Anaerolineaceae bacterium]|nr:nodulation protein NfeD [Anaerolineaceae bacterium]HPN51535.1 nodulation protein NfeD [Anaerolineaceae bacterium]
MKRWLMKNASLFLLLMVALSSFIPAAAQSSGSRALVLTINDAITPITADYLRRGLAEAGLQQAELVIVALNTPGGSGDVMDEMVSLIRESPVPVVVYVSPRGAMAGSAGTLITLAGHAAAMAPETVIGAASPVGSQGEDLGETLESKIKEIYSATARTLAERRGPEAVAVAEATINSARAVTSSEALEIGLVDFIAEDIPDLLRQMDGFSVTMADGERTLHTTGLTLVDLPFTLVEQLLVILINPNIVFLLLSVGVQAILIELSSPGGWVAGFIGVVCLALAAYGIGVLPVNWFGLAFIVIAVVLFILEFNTPTHGGMAAAGGITFIIGALVLFNSPGVPPVQQVSVPLVVATGVVMVAAVLGVMAIALRTLRQPALTGRDTFNGKVGLAQTELAPAGQVQLGGEQWSAVLLEGEAPIPQGAAVEVVRLEGIRLVVRARQPSTK